jgi:hypothetical protein
MGELLFCGTLVKEFIDRPQVVIDATIKQRLNCESLAVKPC